MHDLEILEKCRPFTMTSPERLLQTIWSVRRAIRENVPGDFVEVGVWRGGSVMAMLLALLDEGATDRRVHLYDTFEGMTPPSERDVDHVGNKASDIFERVRCVASLEDVRQNVGGTGYPLDLVSFHVGDVRLAKEIPESISVLRIDCDWHDLVAHCLAAFEPRVVSGGVITIDDYGHWKGAREAVDEFLGRNPIKPELRRIDYTGVYWVNRTR